VNKIDQRKEQETYLLSITEAIYSTSGMVRMLAVMAVPFSSHWRGRLDFAGRTASGPGVCKPSGGRPLRLM